MLLHAQLALLFGLSVSSPVSFSFANVVTAHSVTSSGQSSDLRQLYPQEKTAFNHEGEFYEAEYVLKLFFNSLKIDTTHI